MPPATAAPPTSATWAPSTRVSYSTMRATPRYRFEDDTYWIDVRLASVEQLFDNRDPAPFRERDLDPDLVEYLIAAAEDLVAHGPFRIAFWLPAERPVEEISHAFQAHFDYELERLERRRRRQRRTGQVSLVIGVALLIVLLSLAHFLPRVLPEGSTRDVTREGLVIL